MDNRQQPGLTKSVITNYFVLPKKVPNWMKGPSNIQRRLWKSPQALGVVHLENLGRHGMHDGHT